MSTDSTRSTVWKDGWLKERDKAGNLIGEWCKVTCDGEQTATCKVCNKTVNFQQNGISGLKSHSSSASHQRAISTKQSSKSITSFLTSQPRNDDSANHVLDAEIIWSLHTVECHNSYLSNNHVCDAFRGMFKKSKVAEKMSLKESKTAYVIKDAIFPFLQNQLALDLANTEFSIHIDEANKIRNHLGIVVRYMPSNSWDLIIQSFDIPAILNTNAETISSTTLDSFMALDIPTSNLIAVMSDSCNTMRGQKSGVIKRLQDELPQLLDLGGCSLHYIHNSVRYAVDELDSDIEDIISDLFTYFRYSSNDSSYAVSAALTEVECHKFLRLVETRWLQCLPVIERILEQLPALKHYFNEMMNRPPSSAGSRDRLKRLTNAVSDPFIECTLNFVRMVLVPLNEFEKAFQGEGCLVFDLWSRMKALLLNFLVMFKPANLIDQDKPWIIKDGFLPDHELIIGPKASALVLLLSESDRLRFYAQAKAFYSKCAEKLVHYLPFDNALLRNLRFLDPKSLNSKNLETYTMNVAKKMPSVIQADQLTALRCEIRSLKLTAKKGDQDVISHWKRMTTEHNIPILAKLVRACLILPHGNADVERLFSMMSDIVTDKRSCLDQQSIRALTFIKSHLTAHNQLCHTMPITDQLRERVSSAKQLYKERLKRQRDEEEKERQLVIQKNLEAQIQQEKENNMKLKKIDLTLDEIQKQKKEAIEKRKHAEELEKQARMLREEASKEEEHHTERQFKVLEKKAKAEKRITEKIVSSVRYKIPKL